MGNTQSRGFWKLVAREDGGTDLAYEERMTFRIPLPRLLLPVVKPFAVKESKKSIGLFLDNIKATCELP